MLTAVLAWLGIALGGVALIALGLAVVESVRVLSSRRLALVHRRSCAPTLALLVGAVAFGSSSLLLTHAAAFCARARVLAELNSPPPGCSLALNGSAAVGSDRLLASLRQIRDVGPRHSHLTRRFQVTIRSGDSVSHLVLARDSQVPTEYRVLWSGAFLPTEVVLGSISTTVLDEP